MPMQPCVYIVADECPTPCSEVILLKRRDTGDVIAFCATCGAGWPDPHTFERFEGIGDLRGLSYDPAEYAPHGVELPSRAEIEAAGLGHLVLREIPVDDWNGTPTDGLSWIEATWRRE